MFVSLINKSTFPQILIDWYSEHFIFGGFWYFAEQIWFCFPTTVSQTALSCAEERGLGSWFGFMSSTMVWEISTKLENEFQTPNVRKNKFAQSTATVKYFLR